MSLINKIKNSKIKDTLSHAKNYFFTSVATQGISLISIPIFTRLLTTADYGIINVFVTYVQLFSIILPLNLYSAVSRYYYEEKDDFESFLGTSIVLSYSFLFFFLGIIMIFRPFFAQLLHVPENTIFFFIPATILAVMDAIFMAIFVSRRNSKVIMKFSTIQAYIGFLITVGIIYWMFINHKGNRYIGRLWGDVIIFIIFGAFKFYQISTYIKFSIKKAHVKYILGYSLPLIPYLLSGQILSQFDRVMISKYKGDSDSGLYSFAYNISMLQLMVSNALYNAFMPEYFKFYNEKKYKEHDIAVVQLFNIITVSAVFFILYGYEIGKLLGSKSYATALIIIPIVMIGHWFTAITGIYNRNFQFQKKTYIAAIVVLSGGFLNVLLNYYYIPKYGFIAAAYTTSVSYFYLACASFLASKYLVKTHVVNPIAFLKHLIIMIIIVVLYNLYFATQTEYFFTNIILKALLLISATGILYLSYLNQFISKLIKLK